MSNLEFSIFLAVAVPGLFLPTAIAWWKRRNIVSVALLSLAFWRRTLVLDLRLKQPAIIGARRPL